MSKIKSNYNKQENDDNLKSAKNRSVCRISCDLKEFNRQLQISEPHRTGVGGVGFYYKDEINDAIGQGWKYNEKRQLVTSP